MYTRFCFSPINKGTWWYMNKSMSRRLHFCIRHTRHRTTTASGETRGHLCNYFSWRPNSSWDGRFYRRSIMYKAGFIYIWGYIILLLNCYTRERELYGFNKWVRTALAEDWKEWNHISPVGLSLGAHTFFALDFSHRAHSFRLWHISSAVAYRPMTHHCFIKLVLQSITSLWLLIAYNLVFFICLNCAPGSILMASAWTQIIMNLFWLAMINASALLLETN